MIRRREFIGLLGGAAAAWPLGARAQQGAKVRRVAIVVEGMRSPAYDGFLQGMDDLGYVAGKDYLIEWRFADGRYLRILELVGDFAKLNIDVIFLGNPAMIYPVRQATRTIPIVMGYSTDPVGNGFVTNMAHPGGNLTGLASSSEDTSPRQLKLLAAVVPNLARVGLLQNPENSSSASVLKSTQAAAQMAGLELVPVDARAPQEIDTAFQILARERVGALKVSSDRFFLTRQQQLADLALKYRLPSIFAERDYVEAGGLMSLDESLKDFYQHAASFVDRIFKGAKPGDLPIEQLSLLDLVINRKTAQQLGVSLPPATDVSAYDVID
ncbi:MAG TPA: ABC transporter substrate-binding protein [Xanthobacteraceae bacterium]|jgi:putative ABC transport system substrate-binding protein|nr:ABC transporter substrate-binding protein [Xanthobacteraceae bacterium]